MDPKKGDDVGPYLLRCICWIRICPIGATISPTGVRSWEYVTACQI